MRRAIAFDPRVWSASIDDSAPDAEEWRPADDPRIIYVLASDSTPAEDEAATLSPDKRTSATAPMVKRPVATFTLCPQNAVCYELHMDRVFGAGPARALRELFAWAFAHTPARRIVASIPADNPIAIRAARRAGMQDYGINPQSFERRGILHDQILLGVSKCRVP